MAILASLEDTPRGVYCGAVGLVGPSTAPFAVPIRTALVDRWSGTAVYGTGGGVTWSSDAATEWEELLAKAPRVEPERRLLQTMRYAAGVGVVNADRHVAHLAASAAWLGFACDTAGLLDRLASVAAPHDLRVRLLLGRDGSAAVETHRLVAEPPVQVLAIDHEPVHPRDPWLRHKSDERSAYATRLARHPDATDVVLVNTDGFVTETARANLVVRLDGRWVTPPVSDGLLPGVGRELLLDNGDVIERSVTVAECREASTIQTVSSLWGRRDAVLRR
jgi:para-aminobenzoate synthetase/4-amino-4-deoxychorismate lyase